MQRIRTNRTKNMARELVCSFSADPLAGRGSLSSSSASPLVVVLSIFLLRPVDDEVTVSLDTNFEAGLVTNTILFCWRLTIKNRCKQVRFWWTHTVKVCVSCFWRCSGPLDQGAKHLTVPLWLQSSGINASRGQLEGCCVSSKSPSEVRNRAEGVAGRNGGSMIVSPRDHWFALYAMSQMSLTKSKLSNLS